MRAAQDVFVQQFLEVKTSDLQDQKAKKDSVEQMAFEVQKRAAKQSELLRQPVKKLSERGQDGGEVANALINLKMKVEELDPGKFDFEAGWMTRTLGRIPGSDPDPSRVPRCLPLRARSCSGPSSGREAETRVSLVRR